VAQSDMKPALIAAHRQLELTASAASERSL
jgi:hypothetical protein